MSMDDLNPEDLAFVLQEMENLLLTEEYHGPDDDSDNDSGVQEEAIGGTSSREAQYTIKGRQGVEHLQGERDIEIEGSKVGDKGRLGVESLPCSSVNGAGTVPSLFVQFKEEFFGVGHYSETPVINLDARQLLDDIYVKAPLVILESARILSGMQGVGPVHYPLPSLPSLQEHQVEEEESEGAAAYPEEDPEEANGAGQVDEILPVPVFLIVADTQEQYQELLQFCLEQMKDGIDGVNERRKPKGYQCQPRIQYLCK